MNGLRFAPTVCWRASKRGLVIAGIDGDALLLDHPRAARLPEMLADHPVPGVLAERLGPPNAALIVQEMTEAGVLTDTHGDPPAPPAPLRGVVLTRSGGEFPGIERPARWLDRHLVPAVLSWPGRVVLGAVVLGGLASLLTGRPEGPAVSARPIVDALLGLAVMLVLAALHELAHAIALVHYGRSPRRAGFGFYWGGISFYVDSTEALTLPRRARVVQALVGLAVDAVTVSLLAIVAQLSSTVLIVAVCWRLAVVGVVDLVTNLLPILEVDGHWALADHLDEPELAGRARAAFGAALRGRSRDPGTPTWLPVYGAASLFGGVTLLVGGALVWWAVAADLLAALFTGHLAEIVVGLALVGPVLAGLVLSTLGLAREVAAPPQEPSGPEPAPVHHPGERP